LFEITRLTNANQELRRDVCEKARSIASVRSLECWAMELAPTVLANMVLPNARQWDQPRMSRVPRYSLIIDLLDADSHVWAEACQSNEMAHQRSDHYTCNTFAIDHVHDAQEKPASDILTRSQGALADTLSWLNTIPLAFVLSASI
jgi:hypothetical protein